MAKRTASARKQARSGAKRALRNRSIKSAVKTGVVKARRALGEGAEGAAKLAVAAISGLDRAAGRGALHPNNAARRKSRLMKALNAALNPEAAAPPAPAKGTSGKAAGAKAGSATKGKSPAKPAASKAAGASKAAKTASGRTAAKPAARKK